MEMGNVLLIGDSGVGKSTLINAILEDENAAKTGKGYEGVNKEVKVYTENDYDTPFRLVDTIGFEPGRSSEIIKKLKKWIEKGEGKQYPINVIWFCVPGTSGKLFPKTIKDMLKVTEMFKTIPIIVVITKSYSRPEREENIALVKEAFNKYAKDPARLKKVIPVVAKPYIIDDENAIIAPPDGIEELITVTNQFLPEGVEASKKDVSAFILKRKRILAHSWVASCTASAGVIGGVPIPFSDAVLLVPLETTMLSGIAKIYNIKTDDDSSTFKKAIIDSGTVSVAAKALISAAKAIPGINVAISVLNTAIASVIVETLGELSIYAYEQVYLGKKSFKDIDWITTMIEKKFKELKIVEIIESILKKWGAGGAVKDK